MHYREPGIFDDGGVDIEHDVHVYPDLNSAADIVDHATRYLDVEHDRSADNDKSDYVLVRRTDLDNLRATALDRSYDLAGPLVRAARTLVDNAADVARNRPE